MSLKKYIAEFIGTFFLVLTVCMITFSKVSADIQPIVIGLMLTGLIYSKGFISGAQFNPAISLAFLLRGKMTIKEAAIFSLTHFTAAAAAAFMTGFLISGKPPVAPLNIAPQFFSVIPAILAEIMGAFLMGVVILNVATSKSLEGNSFYGIAIGFVVTGLIYTFGSVSGSCLNPAIALASCITKLSSWNYLWIYIVGNLAGGALSAIVWKYMNTEE